MVEKAGCCTIQEIGWEGRLRNVLCGVDQDVLSFNANEERLMCDISRYLLKWLTISHSLHQCNDSSSWSCAVHVLLVPWTVSRWTHSIRQSDAWGQYRLLSLHLVIICDVLCCWCYAVVYQMHVFMYFITHSSLFSVYKLLQEWHLLSFFHFSWLDYCNALLIGLPFSTIAPLQRVQNAVARLLRGLLRRDHVRPALKELHWLPVVHRIQFKLALVMFTIHTHRCPDYLSDSVQACNSDPARIRLRSASTSDYTVPRTRTKFGDRAFSVAGPVVWNSLPAAVREADSMHLFRCKLKTHLFTLCFNDWLTVFRLL